MQSLVLLAIACGVASASFSDQEYASQFAAWMLRHGKSYTRDDVANRFSIFRDNLDYIAAHNALYAKGLQTYSMSANQFADLTVDEYRAKYINKNKYQEQRRAMKTSPSAALPSAVGAMPTSWDWRKIGGVLPVQNEDQCGSCWAYTATDSVVGAWFLATGLTLPLSTQQIVDCSGPEGNDGCNGGLPSQAMQYVIDNKGLCLADDYPWTGEDGTCRASNCTAVATITSFVELPVNDESAIMPLLYQTPISTAVNAALQSFMYYESGVYNDPACDADLDHGMTFVGWGTQPASNGNPAQDYWILRNMWGPAWGEQGYMRIIRGKNECGLSAAPPVYAVFKPPAPIPEN